MSARMYFQGVLPRNNKEQVVLQVVNAAHARPAPAVSVRKSMWGKRLRLWCPSWYLGYPFVLVHVLMLVGLPCRAARDVGHNCLLTTYKKWQL